MALFRAKPGDFFLIILCSSISLLPALLLRSETNGKTFDVMLDNKIILTASLEKDTSFTFDGELGAMEIVVHNGNVFISKSLCPHKYCMTMGKTSSSNKPLVCLPNKVIIKVNGQNNEDIDAILR